MPRKSKQPRPLAPKYRVGDGLNEERIRSESGGERLRDCGTSASSVAVEALFDDLEARVVAEIGAHPAVVGCVAWLTSEPILEALATRELVSIVVQKEDFLRPDAPGGRRDLRALYEAIPAGSRMWDEVGLNHLSYAIDDTLAAIRCCGPRSQAKRLAAPRMHHKFAVFLDYVGDGAGRALAPSVVWTGSFNWTRNASRCLENAVILRHHGVAQAYFEEWQQVVSLSEPLDWTSIWVEPEWRIGS